VSRCDYDCKPQHLQGTDDTGQAVLDLSNLTDGGSYEVTPTRSTTYRLTVADCRGHISAQQTVTVSKPVKLPAGVAEILVFNCHVQRYTVSIWTNDLTAGTGWQRQGSLDAQYDQFGTCGQAVGAQPFVVKLQSGHQYEIVIVDPAGCGQDNPTIINCRKYETVVVGGATGAASITVS
jgi:hypothetical protein